MAVFLLTSASGSPGATTTALGVSLTWPESVMYVDADCQQALLSGHFGGQLVTSRSISAILNTIRNGGTDIAGALLRQAVPIGDEGGEGGRRRLALPGLTTGHALAGLAPAWPALAEGLHALGGAGVDAIVDLGRLTPQGIHPDLLGVATEVMLMLRPTLKEVGAARWAAQLLSDQVGTTRKLGLILHDPDPHHVRYDTHEVSSYLNAPVRARLPHDPAAAATWSHGQPPPRGFTRSRYVTGISQLAQSMNAKAHRHAGPPAAAFLSGGV